MDAQSDMVMLKEALAMETVMRSYVVIGTAVLSFMSTNTQAQQSQQQMNIQVDCPDLLPALARVTEVRNQKPTITGNKDDDITAMCRWMPKVIEVFSTATDAATSCVRKGHPSLFDKTKRMQFDLQTLQNDVDYKQCQEMGLIQ